MSVILSKPYQFVPPVRTVAWPAAIHFFRLIDWHLRVNECVLDYELRHEDRLAASVAAGHSIVVTPNHCRYADPIVLGWLARRTRVHFYAMASWHLFNKSKFDFFALRRMGAFSVNREGSDRQALETAIELILSNERPLVLFPEGTTNRTNDVVKPLLDGVTFIARAAAKKLSQSGGKVVMHPIAIKYLCIGDCRPWVDEQLRGLEKALIWRPQPHSLDPSVLLNRLRRVAEAFLSLKEIEYTGAASSGDLRLRRDALIETLLTIGEAKYSLASTSSDSVRERVRKIRTAVVSTYFAADSTPDPAPFYDDVTAADLAQYLLSFPDEYLTPGNITDTKIVETIQRIQEAIFGKAVDTMPLKVVIEVDDAIEVPPERAPRGQTDPLLQQIDVRLRSMLSHLAKEAREFNADGFGADVSS